jgi:soluble lytic murein transglycosylase
MQVMPATGQGIASALGTAGFGPDDLHLPPVAVRFGAWYLANQLAKFGGDPFRALAAYNAGAGPVARWATGDPDLFVERIDYAETKNYVRLLYLHHALYRSLYGGR